MPTVEITKGVYWVGALHPDLRVFDIIMETPEGTSYNAFLVRGEEKTALIDTVKVKFFQDYVKKLEEILPLASIDYLVVNHVEPDHSGSVEQLLDLVPGLTVVGSATALSFLREITNRKFNGRAVSDGEQLELGGRTLTFLNLPFLHWPDSIYTYLEQDRILFTCDSFGSHVPDERLFADLIDRDLTAAYKDYFDAIMGPFKPYVRAALERIEGLPVDIICPGHGPILRQDLERYLQMYREWSQEPVREPGARPKVVVPYVAAYGYTASIAQSVVEGLTTVIDAEVVSMDLIETPVSEVLQELQTADALLVGSPTLNGDAPPPVWNLLTQLSPIVHSRLLASAFGAYGWSGEAVPNITARLASLRMQVVPGLRINFKPSDADLEKAFAFGMEFARALQAKLQPASKRRWRCLVCGHIAVGEEPPAHCPACGVGRENFVEEMPEEEFRLDADKTFVVIGSGIAALSAAEAIRTRNQVGRIVMVTEEEVLPYYRPVLSDLLGEDLPDDRLFIHDQAWYDERRIEVRRGVRVTAIDVKARKVSLDDGSELHYDKLIYAAGSRSIRPPFPGVDLGGVFTLRSLADGRALKRELREGARAVVIGGGVLGLEAAWEMVQRGVQVTVVEGLDRIMPRQLDESSSRRVEALMRERGVQL
ncbi:MAG: FAD-dependent oxidoreductase, partial [Syntrophomonadaceae bacterium]|nr:FAD-dependent oxidoreductase [Syntrophomonadaceae bacterium]